MESPVRPPNGALVVVGMLLGGPSAAYSALLALDGPNSWLFAACIGLPGAVLLGAVTWALRGGRRGDAAILVAGLGAIVVWTASCGGLFSGWGD